MGTSPGPAVYTWNEDANHSGYWDFDREVAGNPQRPALHCRYRRYGPAYYWVAQHASSLFGVGSDEINGAMPTELDPLAKRQCRPTGGVATASSFTVLVFL